MGQLIQLENFARLKPYAGMFAEGLAITVLLALFTVLIGFILALLLALMRMSNFRPFRALGLNRDGHLRDGGFLTMDEDYFLHLTDACREVAEQIYEKHRFFTEMLTNAGVDPITAERDACRIEHVISESSFQRLKKTLTEKK